MRRCYSFFYAILLWAVCPLLSAEPVPLPTALESDNIVNFYRHTAVIATAGGVEEAGLAELKSLGVRMVIDLRTPAEGTAEAASAADLAAIGYANIPLSEAWPSSESVAEFKRLVEDSDNHPLLIHCVTGNRVGMIWAYYRVLSGVSYYDAIAEARSMGLVPRWEAAVRAKLLPF